MVQPRHVPRASSGAAVSGLRTGLGDLRRNLAQVRPVRARRSSREGGRGSGRGSGREEGGRLVLPAAEALRPILAMAVVQSFGLNSPGPNVIRTMIILLLDIVCERNRERLERLLDFPSPEAQDRAERRARQRRCDDPRLGSALGRAIGLFGGHTVLDTVLPPKSWVAVVRGR
jgi:hypothetical protein